MKKHLVAITVALLLSTAVRAGQTKELKTLTAPAGQWVLVRPPDIEEGGRTFVKTTAPRTEWEGAGAYPTSQECANIILQIRKYAGEGLAECLSAGVSTTGCREHYLEQEAINNSICEQSDGVSQRFMVPVKESDDLTR